MRRPLFGIALIASLVGCESRRTVAVHMVIAIDSTSIDTGSTATVQSVMKIIGLRANEFGAGNPAFERIGPYRIAVTFPRVADPIRLARLIAIRGTLQFRFVDKAGAFVAVLPSIDARLVGAGIVGRPATRSVASPLGSYLITAPDTEPQRQQARRASRAPLTSLLFSGNSPGSFVVPQEEVAHVDTLLRHPAARAAMPGGIELLWATTPTLGSGTADLLLYAVQDRPIMTGDYIVDARASDGDGVTLLFQLSERGGQLFEAATSGHVDDYLALVLDSRVLAEPLRIRAAIGQRGSIELGAFKLEDAEDVALIMRTGALPAPIRVLNVRADTAH